jgi:hypothetical protein
MVHREVYGDLDEEEMEGAYWRWAEDAVPVRSAGGWSLPVKDGQIAGWHVLEGERHLSVEEWMYECFRAHSDGELVVTVPGSTPVRLPEGPAAAIAPLLDLIGLPILSAELTDRGDLHLLFESAITLAGRVVYVHCEDRVWELSPSPDGWDLWIE